MQRGDGDVVELVLAGGEAPALAVVAVAERVELADPLDLLVHAEQAPARADFHRRRVEA